MLLTRFNGSHGWLFKKSSLVMMTSMTGVSVIFLLQILIARQLGAKEFGVYSYVLSWVVMLSLLSTFGFEQLQVRYISVYQHEGKAQALISLLKKSRIFVFTMGMLIVLLSGIIVFVFDGNTDEDISMTFYAGLLMIPLMGSIRSNYGVLRGFNEPVRASIIFEIMRPLFFMLFLVVIIYNIDEITAQDVMLVHLLSLIIVLFFSIKWANDSRDKNLRLIRTNDSKKISSNDEKSYQEWGKISISFILIAGAVQIQKNTDIVMLGLLNDMESAGIYTVASRVTHAMILISGILNSVAAPFFSSLYTAGKQVELKKMISVVGKAGAFAALILVFAFYIFDTEILSLFGKEFIEAGTALKILVTAQFIYTLAGPVAVVAMMTDNQNLALKSHIIAAIANIVLNAIFIPFWGVEGAAFATSISIVLWCVLLTISLRNKVGINTTVLT